MNKRLEKPLFRYTSGLNLGVVWLYKVLENITPHVVHRPKTTYILCVFTTFYEGPNRRRS